MLIQLLIKELAMLALLAAVGAAFARALRGRLDAGSQLALAPVFGFAASIALLTTLNFFVPLRHALWFALLPAAIVSSALAVRIGGVPRDWRRHLGALAQIAVVLAGVLAILNAPLERRDSPGPIAWGIYDAPGYTDCIAGFQDHTNATPLVSAPRDWEAARHDREAWKPGWDLGARYCWTYKFSHTGGVTLPAAVSGGLGWPAWEILAPYMALCVLMAALGTYALFRVVTRSRSWLAAGAGIAAAGAPLFQLYVDGSAGLLGALALMPSLLAVGLLALRETTWRTTVLGAVLLAGLLTAYPEMAPVALGTLLVAVTVRLVSSWRGGVPLATSLRAGLPHLVALGGLAVLFSPRAAIWAVGNLSRNDSFVETVIDYNMQVQHLPGWLMQTREFYTFALTAPRGITYATVGVALPLLLIGVAAYGCVRRRAPRVLLAFVAVASVQALYAAAQLDCSYCVGRTLATTAPVLVVLFLTGVHELTRSPVRRRFGLGAVLGTTAAIAAAASLFAIEQRAYRGAYMPPPDLQRAADAASELVDGPLQLEAFGQTPLWAWGENRTTYRAMAEATGERISLASAYNDYGGLSYVNVRPIGHASYTPRYEFVLSRLSSLDSGRPVLYRSGTLSLQRRLRPFDATVARGVAVETHLRDPGGIAWVQRPGAEMGFVQGPLTFWVSALSRERAYVRVVLSGPTDLRAGRSPGATTTRLADGRTAICVPVPGRGELRVVELPLSPLPTGLTPPSQDPFSTSLPDENAPYVAREVSLDRLRVSRVPCTGSRL